MRFATSSSRHFRLAVGNVDAFILGRFDIREDFELGFETQGFAIVKMHIGNVGSADYAKVFLLRPGVEEAGNEMFENLLPDIGGEVFANQRRGSLAGAETREPRPVLERLRYLCGLGLDCLGGNRNFKLVLTTFH